MNYTTLQNTPLNINFNDLLNDRSWIINGDTATHYPCNGNSVLKLISYDIIPNINYSITFKIIAMSNSPILKVGFDTPLYTYTTPQDVTITLNSNTANKKLTFWGTGYIVLEVINIQKESEVSESSSEKTITWSEISNRWISFRSYRPEKGFSMFTDMFTLKRGELWIHKEGSLRNNFYTEQFQTSIKFPTTSLGIKTYHSVAIHADQIMTTTEGGITTQLGQVSDLIEIDFTTREGIQYANFLRDKLTDIVNGDRLKGRFIVMELITKEGDKKLQLFKVVTKSSISTPSE